jgi:hypothetical protein
MTATRQQLQEWLNAKEDEHLEFKTERKASPLEGHETQHPVVSRSKYMILAQGERK